MIIIFLISFYTIRLRRRRQSATIRWSVDEILYFYLALARWVCCMHNARRDDNEISRKCIIYGLTSLRMHAAKQPVAANAHSAHACHPSNREFKNQYVYMTFNG